MRILVLLLLLVISPLKAEIYNIDQLDLKDQVGKVVYLDFWASWCKPCRESFPWMNSLLARYPADRFTVITINLDAETDEMHRFLSKIGAEFDIYHDPSGAIAEQFELEGMPTSYLIDANGKVVRKHIGFYTRKVDEYEREIEELL
ncbi:MAG: TlpA family protein disulfide reductase [Gammaproteobacteria bacterium]|nr:TlpA family protein disulfide reductase [Gammaproteobacteria bacterium]